MKTWYWWASAALAAAAAAWRVGRARRPARPAGLPTALADPATLAFPPGFRFGAATAAHQVEGGLADNNWTRWERREHPLGGPTIRTGERVGRASDHWGRFESDLALMQALDLDVYRFSVEWSRIEPTPGTFDDEALGRYRAWCRQLRAAGIAPMVTLHHFTEPGWITARGGFENPATVGHFSRFVERVVPYLADLVDDWVTVNEPGVYAAFGWLSGEFPPGVRDFGRMARVVENLLLAHAAAYRHIHALDRIDADGDGVAARVGLVKNVVPFEARAWWNPADHLAAAAFDRAFNHAIPRALATGRLRLGLPGQGGHGAEHPELRGTWDFFGLNHYFRALVGVDRSAPEGFSIGFADEDGAAMPDNGARLKNDLGWDLLPHTLYEAMHAAARYGKPIIVTENGVADAETPDRRRVEHLAHALQAVHQALADGVDVRGYLHWSLLDNFEWAHGFGPRFGLFRVDYATQERTWTEGARAYRAVLSAHARRRAEAQPSTEGPSTKAVGATGP